MASSEITFDVKLSPAYDTVDFCKKVVEMWVNDSPHRGIKIREAYPYDNSLPVISIELTDDDY